MWMIYIYRAGMGTIHKSNHALNQITQITKGTGSKAISIKRQGLISQCLNDEVAHHASIVGQHSRCVGVVNPHAPNLNTTHALVVGTEGLGDALALVIPTTYSD